MPWPTLGRFVVHDWQRFWQSAVQPASTHASCAGGWCPTGYARPPARMELCARVLGVCAAACDEQCVHRRRHDALFNADPASPSDNTYTYSQNLVPNQVYHWRVASECGETDMVGSYSAAFTYRAGPPGGVFPPAPALIAPADGVTTASVRVTLMYGNVSAADMYNVRLYPSLARAQNDSSDHHYSTNGTAVVDVSNPETTWYWRVKTRASYGWSDLSGIRMFHTPQPDCDSDHQPGVGRDADAKRRVPHGQLPARCGEQPDAAQLPAARHAAASDAELSVRQPGVHARRGCGRRHAQTRRAWGCHLSFLHLCG